MRCKAASRPPFRVLVPAVQGTCARCSGYLCPLFRVLVPAVQGACACCSRALSERTTHIYEMTSREPLKNYCACRCGVKNELKILID